VAALELLETLLGAAERVVPTAVEVPALLPLQVEATAMRGMRAATRPDAAACWMLLVRCRRWLLRLWTGHCSLSMVLAAVELETLILGARVSHPWAGLGMLSLSV
jgi:hypothetical protein